VNPCYSLQVANEMHVRDINSWPVTQLRPKNKKNNDDGYASIPLNHEIRIILVPLAKYFGGNIHLKKYIFH
jgi:hypothetical protein